MDEECILNNTQYDQWHDNICFLVYSHMYSLYSHTGVRSGENKSNLRVSGL